MNDEKIYHLSYVSTGCDGLRYEHIKEILDTAKRKNSEVGITGILVYCNKHFFQILEGNQEDVEALYNKIAIDPRHDNVIKLQSCNIQHRQFENWSMGFKSYNKELKELDNFKTEEFYSYVQSQLNGGHVVSLKILADFFDLNG
jgi:hypothetical protein